MNPTVTVIVYYSGSKKYMYLLLNYRECGNESKYKKKKQVATFFIHLTSN